MSRSCAAAASANAASRARRSAASRIAVSRSRSIAPWRASVHAPMTTSATSSAAPTGTSHSTIVRVYQPRCRSRGQRERREGREPVRADVVAAVEAGEAGVEMPRRPPRRGPAARDRPPAARRAMPRRHHARDRLRPSRCTICGSLRSVTRGRHEPRVERRRAEAAAAPASSQPSNASAGEHAGHQVRLDERRRQEIGAGRLPRDRQVAVGGEPRARRLDDHAPRASARRRRARSRARAAARTRCSRACRSAPDIRRRGRNSRSARRLRRASGASASPARARLRQRRRRRRELLREREQPRPAVRPLERLRAAAAAGTRPRRRRCAGVMCAASTRAICGRSGKRRVAARRAHEQPVHVHARVPVVAAVERRMQLARGARVVAARCSRWTMWFGYSCATLASAMRAKRDAHARVEAVRPARRCCGGRHAAHCPGTRARAATPPARREDSALRPR